MNAKETHPDWKDPHPCQICRMMIQYKEGLSHTEWACSYHSCCSDECREKLIDLNTPSGPEDIV